MSNDISPEHTARAMKNDLHPEVVAAYAYVDRVLHTADPIAQRQGVPAWNGWALREAFLAGCSHAAALAQPEPVAPVVPTDEEWDAMKERLWDQYQTIGYQGERFMYDNDFSTAFDDARAVLAHWGRPAIEPVPLSERLPGADDCDTEGRCWCFCSGAQIEDTLIFNSRWHFGQPIADHETHWLPHWALPVPTPATPEAP